MKPWIVSPARGDSIQGNGVTARRWAAILRDLGHEVRVAQSFPEDSCRASTSSAREPVRPPDDLPRFLVALHARRSAASIEHFARLREQLCLDRAPLIVALTGTDLYQDLAVSEEAKRSIDLADRLIVLQSRAAASLPEEQRAKVRVIRQSVDLSELPEAERRDFEHGRREDSDSRFCLLQLAHLREVKDPLLGARALMRLEESVPLHIRHYGAVLEPEWEAAAREAMAEEPRYEWREAKLRSEVMPELAQADALLHCSRLEGGANAISEAIVLAVPVLSSRIEGSVGMLGEDYEGYFEAGSVDSLAALLERFVRDSAFRARLREQVAALSPQYAPAREREAWASLLAEFDLPTSNPS